MCKVVIEQDIFSKSVKSLGQYDDNKLKKKEEKKWTIHNNMENRIKWCLLK